jgi:hypothetical protein
MAAHNIDPRYPTPYVSETDYSLNGWPRPKSRFTPYRPDPVTMYWSWAMSVRGKDIKSEDKS